MPVLHFTNSTPDSLNLGAFLSGLPSQYQNELASGETWAHDFPTLPFSSFEARVDSGPANRFHPDSAAKDFGTMAGAVGKGTASVLKGAGGLAGAGPTGFAGLGGTANVMQEASDLMNAASADGQAFGKDAEGLCLRVAPFNVGWQKKKYTLRKAEDGHVELYDDDESRVL